MNAYTKLPMASVRGSEALWRLLECNDVRTVLDIGSGTGEQAAIMRAAGRKVITVSMEEPADHLGDFCGMVFDEQFDAIWASHVLEHQPDVGFFLRCCFETLRDGGVLAITVPPIKHDIVGGHLTVWNAGLLLYNLIIAGFDCRTARVSPVYSSGPGYPPYNISVIVRKVAAHLPALRFDSGDIERLAAFFPCPVKQGFDGRLAPIGW